MTEPRSPAEDVKYTVDRLVAVNIGVARSLGMVTGADVIDDLTVRIDLSQPFPGFLGAISRLYILNSELVQANTVDDDWGQTWIQNHDAGSGPYVLTSFTPEQEFTIESFPDYFKGWEGNHVDRAIFVVLKEESTRRLALENGDAHWIHVGSPETLDALKENPAYTANADATLNQLYFALNNQHEILQDARVRKALSLVYDYEGHVELARNGYAAIARGVIPPGIVCFDPSAPESAMDVEQAKQLMAEAGYADGGFELTMAYQGTSAEETAAMQIMQDGAANLGITIRPMSIEWPAKVQAFSAQETAPDVGTVWMYPSLPDPDQFVGILGHSSQAGGGGYNFSWYSNPDMDALIAAGKIELDPGSALRDLPADSGFVASRRALCQCGCGYGTVSFSGKCHGASNGHLRTATPRTFMRCGLTNPNQETVQYGASGVFILTRPSCEVATLGCICGPPALPGFAGSARCNGDHLLYLEPLAR